MRQICLLLAGAFIGCSLSAQEAAKIQPKHPGDVITLEVKFEGPDASKVKRVRAFFTAKTMDTNQMLGHLAECSIEF